VLESELSAMMDGAFGVANHLQKVESKLKSTVQLQEQTQQRDMGNLPYNEAVRLASKGADVSELVEHCGLSRSEAELVEMLHKTSPPPTVSDEYPKPAAEPVRSQRADAPLLPNDNADSIAAQESGPKADEPDFSMQEAAFEPPADPEPEAKTDSISEFKQAFTGLESVSESSLRELQENLDTGDDERLATSGFSRAEFQRALKQAREFQQHSSEPKSEQDSPNLETLSDEPAWPELENQPPQESEPDDKR